MAGIDRINGATPYDNRSVNRRVQDTDGSRDDSGFRLLSEEAGGVIYEPGKAPSDETKTIAQIREDIAREEREAAKANLHTRFDGPGVAVELSTDGVQAAEKPAQQSILDIFRDTWRSIVNFFLSIWNGGDEKPVGTEADTHEVPESVRTEVVSDSMPERTNAPDDIAAFMADYGGRHLAKNSDLLTQYDRRGHIVDVDPSDRRRILQGEGRVRRF